MDRFSICEHGHATTISHEPFSMKFEFADFRVQESYGPMRDEGVVVRKIIFPKQVSSERVIGQTINFPSSWRVSVRCKDSHARVALELRKLHLTGQQAAQTFAVIKFKICFIDKDGDTLYDQQWQSWHLPKRIELTKEHAKIDYISLVELFDNQAFYAPNKTLRVLCEGVIFSSFVHLPVKIEKNCPFAVTMPSPGFVINGKDCDIHLFADNGTCFKAHKLVLGKASVALQKAFVDGNGTRSKHDLNEVTESSLANMLHYIYEGSTQPETDWSKYEDVEELIKLAKHYDLQGLAWLCYKNILKTMTLASFTQVVQMFQTNSVTDETFRSILTGYFIKHQGVLVESEKFQQFAKEEKEAFLYVALFNGRGNS